MHGSKLNTIAMARFSRDFSSIIIDDFFSRHKTISGQQIVTFSPVKQVNFFILKILFDQWQVETKKLKSPFFDYQKEEVSTALNTLVNTLSKNISIEKKNFIPLVDAAIKSSLEFLYDPASYLHAFLGSDPDPDKLRVLKTNNKYLKAHRPLIDLLIDQLAQVDSSQVENILDQSVLDYTPSDEDTQALIAQFNEVCTLDILEAEEIAIPEPVQEIKELFKETPIVEEEIIEEEVAIKEESILANEPELQERETEPITQKEEKIAEQFEPFKEEEATVKDNNSINAQYAEEVQTLNQRFEEPVHSNTVAAINESKPISDLKNNININQKYMFVHDLFEGNEQEYEDALDEVELTGSFDASVQLLVQRYAKKYTWDMNSEEIKELLKVVFKRFR